MPTVASYMPRLASRVRTVASYMPALASGTASCASCTSSVPSKHAKTVLLASAIVLLAGLEVSSASDWPQFRGPGGTSIYTGDDLPLDFDVKTGRNVAWRAPLPGKGPSSPIVVAGRVIVTAASGPRQDRLHVLCFDCATGKLLWHRQLWATGSTVCNSFGGVAAPTPASDGRRVVALFSSSDMACFDLDGNLLWYRGLGYESPNTRNDVGMGSSPLMVGPETVVVQLENLGESFAVGIDAATGVDRWRIPRPRGSIWSSPIPLPGPTPAEDLVLLHSRQHLTAHQASTGKQVWQYEAFCHTIASAVVLGQRIYLPAIGLHALRYDPQRRTVEKLWYDERLRSDNCSPVVAQDRCYVIKPPNILMCADAADGRTLWQLRLKGPFWATPLMAGRRLYCVNYDGLVQVVQLGDEGKLISACQLESGALASPAAADGALYFRTHNTLWKIAEGSR